jgi:hypothetical protein
MLSPYLVYQAIIGRYHVRPLPYLLGNAPTVGQGIYIAIMTIISTVLSGVGFGLVVPHAWYSPSLYFEGLAYVMWRTGALGFVILPLVFLFSSRKILLWLTNWTHSTFLLLHRWIGRIFGAYVIEWKRRTHCDGYRLHMGARFFSSARLLVGRWKELRLTSAPQMQRNRIALLASQAS